MARWARLGIKDGPTKFPRRPSFTQRPSLARRVSHSPIVRSRKWIIICFVMVGISILALALGLGLGLGLKKSHAAPISTAPTRGPEQIQLDYATYQGPIHQNGVVRWLGLRFAAPPVGNLRFAAPQPPLQYSAPQRADQMGLTCLMTNPTNPGNPKESEDCLFLDIYTPMNATTSSKLPVFFFIQGGGMNEDASPNYNGSGLVRRGNIVVVDINYRVGPYGFLASSEVQQGASLNNGLKDQRMALQWVQKYISFFGGDPNHVILGGSSAGAGSIVLQLSAYGGRNDSLFIASAAESQSFPPVLTVAESQYQYNNLTARLGCAGQNDTLACLRGVDVLTFQQNNIQVPYPNTRAAPIYMYNPVVDNDFIQDVTVKQFQLSNFVKVPSIWGDDTDEGTVFTPQNITTPAETDDFVLDQFPALTPQNIAQLNTFYAISNVSDTTPYWHAASQTYGEIRYICPGLYMSNLTAQHGVATTWNYHWNVIDPQAQAAGLGVVHTAEQCAIWGPESVSCPDSYSTINANEVPIIQDYWMSFIKTLNPNTNRAPGAPVWEEFNPSAMNRLLFETNNTRMETVPGDQQDRCNYLYSITVDIQQ